MGVLGYFACEKVALDSFYEGRIVDLSQEALDLFSGDLDIVQEDCHITNSLALTATPELLQTITGSRLGALLTTAAGKVPKEQKDAKALMLATAAALKQGKNDSFQAIATWEFDLTLSQYDIDPYRNGVQDLPKDLKDSLRKGGRFKVFVDEKTRDECFWRASQDLHALQWKMSKDKDYSNAVPIVRIKNVTKGLGSDVLRRAQKREPRKTHAGVCCVLNGPATEECPNGLQLSVKMKSKKERDEFVDSMVTWRDAASYGY